MSIFNRLNLRQSWPLILAAFIFGVSLYLVIVLFRFTPSLDALKFREIIPYWSRVINPSIYKLLENFMVIWASILLISFMVFGIQRLSRYSKYQGIGSILLISANLFSCLVFVMSAMRPDGHELVHVQSLTISDHVYHLTLDNEQVGAGDHFYTKYLIFECDELGNLCSIVDSTMRYSNFDGNPPSAQLTIDPATKMLYLQIDNEKPLIVQ